MMQSPLLDGNDVVLTAVTKHCEETGRHCARVQACSRVLAQGMYHEFRDMIPSGFVDDLFVASALHDLGKITVPPSLLAKLSPLTTEEVSCVQRHTVVGHRILAGCKFFESHKIGKIAKEVALFHHERWDGSGYPAGLKGDAIPLSARIVMASDIFDALRNSRAYKASFSMPVVCDIMFNGDGRTMPGHFDPRVLGVLRKVVHQMDDVSASTDASFEQRYKGGNDGK